MTLYTHLLGYLAEVAYSVSMVHLHTFNNSLKSMISAGRKSHYHGNYSYHDYKLALVQIPMNYEGNGQYYNYLN